MIADTGFILLNLAAIGSFSQLLFALFLIISKSKLLDQNFISSKFLIKKATDVDFILKKQIPLTFFVTICCITSMLCLIYSFIISDFSVSNVYYNSSHLKPLIYKISGAWGNHEGSILLLVTILTIYNAAFAILSKIKYDDKAFILIVQAFITFGILFFIILTSNPFLKIYPTPKMGLGLNPLLQDIGLAAHPPMLYTGYIGFSLIFSFAIISLLKENINKNSIKFIKPWLSFSWSFLTLGIGLGSWWAYRELGWGGYWFWDSVENVSLMPWLCGVALLHSVIALEKTGNFKIWSCFLAILTFTFCLLGIFLVRSGILTSIHSFANDPDRGIFIIILFLIIGGLGFSVFAFKSSKIRKEEAKFDIISKSGFILINNFIFCLALFIVALGTLYPIILEIFFDSSISVGPPYYKSLLSPLTILILILMIFVPTLKSSNFKKLSIINIKKLSFSILLSLIILILLIFIINHFNFIAIAATIFSSILILFYLITLKVGRNKENIDNVMSKYAILFAHIGFALIILAISLNAIFSKTIQKELAFNEEINLNSYKIKLEKIENSYGKNYLTRIGIFQIKKNNKIFYLKPESRYYPVSDSNTSEAAIKHNIFSDLYLILGDKVSDNSFFIRIYFKPFISFIWVGCLMIFIGSLLPVCKKITDQLYYTRRKPIIKK